MKSRAATKDTAFCNNGIYSLSLNCLAFTRQPLGHYSCLLITGWMDEMAITVLLTAGYRPLRKQMTTTSKNHQRTKQL